MAPAPSHMLLANLEDASGEITPNARFRHRALSSECWTRADMEALFRISGLNGVNNSQSVSRALF